MINSMPKPKMLNRNQAFATYFNMIESLGGFPDKVSGIDYDKIAKMMINGIYRGKILKKRQAIYVYEQLLSEEEKLNRCEEDPASRAVVEDVLEHIYSGQFVGNS